MFYFIPKTLKQLLSENDEVFRKILQWLNPLKREWFTTSLELFYYSQETYLTRTDSNYKKGMSTGLKALS